MFKKGFSLNKDHKELISARDPNVNKMQPAWIRAENLEFIFPMEIMAENGSGGYI